ncbi:aldehyde dehydrogenase 1A1-like isoform X3 [Leguminivora glycinivorella]|uniref:aldehyde dehydrogenase 1A1-like isoform X3 n=1 Tax=Leguminivora glycinivorella TaxID=1035111 RepID=UPI00200D49E6|nr:aldehyde dehydrogenase 1A1-like isoform X3 [Leguminivora glycinivorella]
MAPEIKYTKLFINNEWVDACSGYTFPAHTPHDGSVIAEVAEGDKADIDLAVAAAKAAFHRDSKWRLLDASARGRLLSKFADLVQRDAQYLGELDSYNTGKNIRMALGIVQKGVNGARYAASLADKIQGDTIPADGDLFSYTLKQPVGVCGLILPWNAAILMFVNKVCTALAAGCTVVVKPAEQAPLTSLALVTLLKEAGIPAGVVNVVTGFGPGAGTALTHHPDVAKISFTGSLEVGKQIQQAAGKANLKRVTLELGGKSPLVIMNDADLNLAVTWAAHGVFGNQGQMCFAASRTFVQSGIYDTFVKKAVDFARNIKIGNPSDPDVDHGPQIFGPVQCIFKFETLKEAIDRANNTNYGLASGIFTKNINDALHFSKHVEAGNVWINTYLASTAQTPFGGFKDSGLGREKGMDCVEEYLEIKTVTISLPKTI